VRSEVFVVEQNCVYQDLDNKDLTCWHLAGYHENVLVAYARLVPPGLSYTEPSIGRVLTLKYKRRFGFGLELMQESIKQIKLLFGEKPVRISAQCYLISFYEKWGFRCVDEPYLEDGIPHQEMLMP
jgi:ElaA protein